MKKVFFMLFAVVIAAAVSAKSSPEPSENEKVRAAFVEQFSGAKDVTWTEKKGFYLASFKLNNDRMLAWYNDDGTVAAVHRAIQVNQMTFLAAEATNNLSKDKQLLSVAEISKDGDLFYLIRVDDAKCTSTYKVSTSGDYSRIEKIKKK